ncbi:MAG: hypothetical protein JWO36_4980 [Myxococcales bacterium]|nr:hypothetical protein [Myxococcales bacterium]
MVFLPGLAVVFVGIVGNNAGKVDHQVKTLLAGSHVQMTAMPAAAVATLAHHGEGCGDLVRQLHVDGVVGGELIANHGHQTLRVAIYAGDGGLKSLAEIPLGGRVLSKDELDVLRSNIEDEVLSLVKVAAEPAPIAQPQPVAVAKVKPPEPPPAPVASTKVAPKSATLDDEDPFETAPRKIAPAPRSAPLVPRTPTPVASASSTPEVIFPDEPVSQPAESHAPAPVVTADASESVSATDIEAMMGGGDTGGGEVQASTTTEATLRLHAAVGIGLATRSFAGPATVPGYASSPVGSIRFDAGAQPTARIALAVLGEQTLQMTTPMGAVMAATTISRWEAIASYTVKIGSLSIAPHVGLGRRTFAIESTDPSRSPDGEYNYVIAGASASIPLGAHLALRGVASLEPVVSGVEPMESAFGEASRWAVDVGAALEARPLTHVFVRVAADYQRFTWSWASARGAGGAIDAYPSGTLSLGAEY